MLLSGLRSGSPPKVKRARVNPIMARRPPPPRSIHRMFLSYRFGSIETLQPAKHLRSGVKIQHIYTLPHFQDS